MKQRTAILIVLVAGLLPAVSAFAYGNPAAFTPTGVQAGWSDGHIYIYGATATGCTQSTVLASASSYADTTRLTNLATAAFLSGRKLSCFTNGCDAQGYAMTVACILQ